MHHNLLLFAHLLLYVTGVLLYGFLARELPVQVPQVIDEIAI